MGWSLSPLQSWCPHGGKETVRKHVSHLGYALQVLSQGFPSPHHTLWDSGWGPVTVVLPNLGETLYTDDITLTCEDVPLLQTTLQALLNHTQQRGQTVNPQQSQGPGTAVTFWGVIQSSKTHVVPEDILDKVQTGLMPSDMKRVQTSVGIGRTGERSYPFSTMPLPVISPGWKGTYSGPGSQTTGCLRESKKYCSNWLKPVESPRWGYYSN